MSNKLQKLFDLVTEIVTELSGGDPPATFEAITANGSTFCWNIPAKDLGDKTTDNVVWIIFFGECKYKVGDCSAKVTLVTENEDNVLQAFLGQSVLSKSELIDRSGTEKAPRILSLLRSKYGRVFAPAIHLPGKANSGGYRVFVRKLAV